MTDERWMRAALSLGRQGLGQVWPNPAVGCVIVNRGQVVGRGATRSGGRPHAETVALAQADVAARGAVAYVTLEPCAHHGQTPPCAEALIAAGIARVVTCLEDPDPRVAGRGHAMLRDAGIDVLTGVEANRARRDQIGFLTRVTRGRPMVTLKLAATLDGRIATASGQSQWITGPQARRVVHAARATHDAVLVGGGTARADDPQLTVRGLGMAQQPIRVIAARRLDLPQGGRLAASADPDLWLIHADDAPVARREFWSQRGARLIAAPLLSGRLDPVAMLRILGDTGLTRVFCEGGGTFAAALLQNDLVDRLMLFTAGFAIGAEGVPGLGALGLSRLDDATRFTLYDTQRLGADTLSVWDRP